MVLSRIGVGVCGENSTRALIPIQFLRPSHSATIESVPAALTALAERESDMRYLDRIVSDPQVCHGKVCIKGTRVMVSVILDNLAAEVPEEEILRNYPTLIREDIRAALEYAAVLAREEIVPLPA
jgi:uncharacterized protein (DUF433 family)